MCVLHEKRCKSNDNKCYRFHYDHRNMFDKSHNLYPQSFNPVSKNEME